MLVGSRAGGSPCLYCSTLVEPGNEGKSCSYADQYRRHEKSGTFFAIFRIVEALGLLHRSGGRYGHEGFLLKEVSIYVKRTSKRQESQEKIDTEVDLGRFRRRSCGLERCGLCLQ